MSVLFKFSSPSRQLPYLRPRLMIAFSRCCFHKRRDSRMPSENSRKSTSRLVKSADTDVKKPWSHETPTTPWTMKEFKYLQFHKIEDPTDQYMNEQQIYKFSAEDAVRRYVEEESFNAQERDIPCDVSPEEEEIKNRRKCILCQHRIPLDYKNVQLLSQFVSPVTGLMYDEKITRLCIPMQRHIKKLLKRAVIAGLMPIFRKELKYMKDPKLFDPNKPALSEV